MGRGTDVAGGSLVEETLAGFADRIGALSVAIEDEITGRDEFIVAAADRCWPLNRLARWSRLHPSRIYQIIAARTAVELTGTD